MVIDTRIVVKIVIDRQLFRHILGCLNVWFLNQNPKLLRNCNASIMRKLFLGKW